MVGQNSLMPGQCPGLPEFGYATAVLKTRLGDYHFTCLQVSGVDCVIIYSTRLISCKILCVVYPFAL